MGTCRLSVELAQSYKAAEADRKSHSKSGAGDREANPDQGSHKRRDKGTKVWNVWLLIAHALHCVPCGTAVASPICNSGGVTNLLHLLQQSAINID
jgi:hypothetical protein